MAANIERRSPTRIKAATSTMRPLAKEYDAGQAQFGWLKDSLAGSNATWNVLANQVIMAVVDESLERKRSSRWMIGLVTSMNETS